MKKRNWYNFRMEFAVIRVWVILLGIAFVIGLFVANNSYKETLSSELFRLVCGYDIVEGSVVYRNNDDTSSVIEAPAPEAVMEHSDHWFDFYVLLGGMLVIGGILVHRESFSENWYVTLRRIPKYRGLYLRSKLFCVYIPGLMYLVSYVLQQLDAWLCYKSLVPEEMINVEKAKLSRLLSVERVTEVLLCVVVLGAASLLLHLVLRHIKKDIPGLVIAVAGILTATGWYFRAGISLWMLGIACLAVMVCLVRNVYFRQ